MNADCYYGDHAWRGSSQCASCGERLRCMCGSFVREDGLNAHFDKCPTVARAEQ